MRNKSDPSVNSLLNITSWSTLYEIIMQRHNPSEVFKLWRVLWSALNVGVHRRCDEPRIRQVCQCTIQKGQPCLLSSHERCFWWDYRSGLYRVYNLCRGHLSLLRIGLSNFERSREHDGVCIICSLCRSPVVVQEVVKNAEEKLSAVSQYPLTAINESMDDKENQQKKTTSIDNRWFSIMNAFPVNP